MTDQQILEATGADLSRMAGEVFLKEIEDFCLDEKNDPDGSGLAFCEHCLKFKNHKCTRRLSCTKLSGFLENVFVPLDWPNAMKYRDWMVAEYGAKVVYEAIRDLYYGKNDKLYALANAQPEHYIKAAMLCKNRSNK